MGAYSIFIFITWLYSTPTSFEKKGPLLLLIAHKESFTTIFDLVLIALKSSILCCLEYHSSLSEINKELCLLVLYPIQRKEVYSTQAKQKIFTNRKDTCFSFVFLRCMINFLTCFPESGKGQQFLLKT